jgi:hypothetical protein
MKRSKIWPTKERSAHWPDWPGWARGSDASAPDLDVWRERHAV